MMRMLLSNSQVLRMVIKVNAMERVKEPLLKLRRILRRQLKPESK